MINDGSDGNAAVIRTSGVLTDLPFLEFLDRCSPTTLPARGDRLTSFAGAGVKLRLHIPNTRDEELPLYRYQLFVLFQSSRGQLFTERAGYGDLNGDQQWLGFDSGDSSFAMQLLSGSYTPLLGRSGSIIGRGAGLTAKACSPLSTDYVEFIVGGPADGLSEAVRRVLGQPLSRRHGHRRDTSGAAEWLPMFMRCDRAVAVTLHEPRQTRAREYTKIARRAGRAIGDPVRTAAIGEEDRRTD